MIPKSLYCKDNNIIVALVSKLRYTDIQGYD